MGAKFLQNHQRVTPLASSDERAPRSSRSQRKKPRLLILAVQRLLHGKADVIEEYEALSDASEAELRINEIHKPGERSASSRRLKEGRTRSALEHSL